MIGDIIGLAGFEELRGLVENTLADGNILP
jgi:hypothetical protein